MPQSFAFVTSITDTQCTQKQRNLTFHVVQKDLDDQTRFWVVMPENAGCVSISFDPTSGSNDTTAVIQDVRYNSRCADEGLPRKYGTRAMMLGILNVFKDVAHTEYQHIRTIEINDEATYPCPSFSVKDDGKIRTFATDLLLRGETYYERHMGVEPRRQACSDTVNRVKSRVSRSIDIDFKTFWDVLSLSDRDFPASDTQRTSKQIDWLLAHRNQIQSQFERHKQTNQSWSAFFHQLHVVYDCVFFSCCWWRLCILFNMTNLVGATWYVPFSALPPKSYAIVNNTDTSAQRGGSAKCRNKIHYDSLQKTADREIAQIMTNKLYTFHGRRRV